MHYGKLLAYHSAWAIELSHQLAKQFSDTTTFEVPHKNGNTIPIIQMETKSRSASWYSWQVSVVTMNLLNSSHLPFWLDCCLVWTWEKSTNPWVVPSNSFRKCSYANFVKKINHFIKNWSSELISKGERHSSLSCFPKALRLLYIHPLVKFFFTKNILYYEGEICSNLLNRVKASSAHQWAKLLLKMKCFGGFF